MGSRQVCEQRITPPFEWEDTGKPNMVYTRAKPAVEPVGSPLAW